VLLVAVTGFQTEAHRREAREAGFDLYLLKPVPLDALHAMLQSVRGRRPALRSFPRRFAPARFEASSRGPR